jgi:hypothetical protein
MAGGLGETVGVAGIGTAVIIKVSGVKVKIILRSSFAAVSLRPSSCA